MKAINPFLVLDVDEAATREEIDAAHRRLVRTHHPDRHASASPERYREAAERMAEINYAYQLLTDPATAAAHKRTFDKVRAAGHHVEPAPQRRGDRAPSDPSPDAPRDYRRAAAQEFTVDPGGSGTPWRARRRRRRWRL